MNRYLILALLLLAPLFLQAQDEEREPLQQELAFSAGLHTNGYILGLHYGLLRSPKQTLFFQLDFQEVKNPKEYKKTYDLLRRTSNTPKTFIYGKRNNLYNLNLSVGQRQYLTQKNARGISIGWLYALGASLGILKPYYLDLVYINDDTSQSIRSESYSEENRARFLDPFFVDGSSGPAYGWNDVSLAGGGRLKLALLLDWGAAGETQKSVELGAMLDFNFQRLPLLVETEELRNNVAYFNIYATVQLGRRW